MLARWAALLVVTSCVSSSSVRCPDGSLCPEGTACAVVDEATLCVSPDQLASCIGKQDFDECAPNQRCYDGVCLPAGCGNTRVDPDEACDDGNTVPNDGCSADCRSDETCGNGVVDLIKREQCDDGPAGRPLSHDGCASDCTLESAQWTLVNPLGEVVAPAITYDAARDRVVLFGEIRLAASTWEWDGARWMLQTPRVSPVSRTHHAMAYDAVRERVVLFGGSSFNDTWEWDGPNWTLQAPATSPPARNRHSMTFDPRRKRIIMYGGFDPQSSQPLGDTWAWDGNNWMKIESATPPPARQLAALTYDAKRDVVVLYGGFFDALTRYDDTWTLAGSVWTKQTPTNVPPARSGHALAWDGRIERVVLHGGTGPAGIRGDTWLWNGSDWELHPTAGPAATNLLATTNLRAGSPIIFDRGKTYRWDTNWTLVEDSAINVVSRFSAAIAVDVAGRRMLMHGGIETSTTASTMVWTGLWQRFTNTAAGSSPGRVSNAALAFDAARREFVHFGGFNSTTDTTTNETWVYTTSWTQRQPPTPLPAPRLGHVLVYDAARKRTVLFGGTNLDDTWLWDGTQWTLAQPTTRPSARELATASYDPIRNVVVLFGGLAGSLPLADTWEWDGTNWTQRMVAGPPARSGAGMAWDPARKRTVLFGGFSLSQTLGDLWEWDGTAWTQVPTLNTVKPRANHMMVSAFGAGVLSFGGTGDGAQQFNELLWLRYDNDAVEELCDDSERDGDALTGCADADCWRVCTPECSPGTSCPAPVRGCGDGTCDAITESCSTCSADCTCAPTCGDLQCGASESCAGDC